MSSVNAKFAASFPLQFLKIVSVNSLSERTFQSGINVLCSYDPDGVLLKFARGKRIFGQFALQTKQRRFRGFFVFRQTFSLAGGDPGIFFSHHH